MYQNGGEAMAERLRFHAKKASYGNDECINGMKPIPLELSITVYNLFRFQVKYSLFNFQENLRSIFQLVARLYRVVYMSEDVHRGCIISTFFQKNIGVW